MNNAIAADSSHRNTGCLVSFIENVLFVAILELSEPMTSGYISMLMAQGQGKEDCEVDEGEMKGERGDDVEEKSSLE